MKEKDKVLSVRGLKARYHRGQITDKIKYNREVFSRISCKKMCKKPNGE